MSSCGLLFKYANAKVSVTGPVTETGSLSSIDFELIKNILGVGAASTFIFGFILLLNSVVLFLIAAGEEPKMERAISELKFGIFFMLVFLILWTIRFFL